MKQTCVALIIFIVLSLHVKNVSAQFVVAQDSVRGRIDFFPRLGDYDNMTRVLNDSVFYMFPLDSEIDPWRYVNFYLPSRTTERGYIQDNQLMRISDYEIIEVERLSSHGIVSFKNDDVRIQISVAKVTSKDTSFKYSNGICTINGKLAEGVLKGRSPKLKYQSISVNIKGKNIIFPKSMYEHLLEPEIDNMAVYYNKDKEIVYIVTNNGGLDAYYSALWAVSPKGVMNVYLFSLDKEYGRL